MQIDWSITTCVDDTCSVFSDNSRDLVHKSIMETNYLIQKLNSIKKDYKLSKNSLHGLSVYNCSNFTFKELIVCYNNNNTYNLTYSKINRVTKIRYLSLIFDCNMR
jgi:hypothetical protein